MSSALVYFGSLLFFAFLHTEVEISWRTTRISRSLFGLALISLFAYTLANCAAMAGSWQASSLLEVLGQTRFGHFSILQAALVIAAVFSGRTFFSTLLVGVAYAALIAAMGHAGAQAQFSGIFVALNGLHVFCSMLWSGGLVGSLILAFFKFPLKSPLLKFASAAAWTTALLALSGAAVAFGLGVRFSNFLSNAYGWSLAAKITLFAAALLCAAINRFIHMRKTEESSLWQKAIMRSLAAEIFFVILAIAFATWMSSQEPPPSESLPVPLFHQ